MCKRMSVPPILRPIKKIKVYTHVKLEQAGELVEDFKKWSHPAGKEEHKVTCFAYILPGFYPQHSIWLWFLRDCRNDP